jgi:hypothetical protein
MAVERTVPEGSSGERVMLTSFLDFQRATLAVKCDGLTDEQLRVSGPPWRVQCL